MGNAIYPSCCNPESTTPTAHLIFYRGPTRTLTGKRHLAGEIMFEFPDHMVCHGDSFFIGHPIPALAIDDELTKGQMYFVIPITCFTRNLLSVSYLAALGSKQYPKQTAVNAKDYPFEYLKGSNGRVLIKVRPQFIAKLLSSNEEEIIIGNHELNNDLCSTPELKKQYDMLVGCNKDHSWSPNLETISEYKFRYSPFRFMGLEVKQKETED